MQQCSVCHLSKAVQVETSVQSLDQLMERTDTVEFVFIDSHIDGYGDLMAAVRPNAQAILLDPASATRTGSSMLGDDWHLDVTTDAMDVELAFGEHTQSRYAGVLAPDFGMGAPMVKATSSISDPFESGMDHSFWQSVDRGLTNANFTGSRGDVLFFTSSGMRQATTQTMDLTAGGRVSVDLILGNDTNGAMATIRSCWRIAQRRIKCLTSSDPALSDTNQVRWDEPFLLINNLSGNIMKILLRTCLTFLIIGVILIVISPAQATPLSLSTENYPRYQASNVQKSSVEADSNTNLDALRHECFSKEGVEGCQSFIAINQADATVWNRLGHILYELKHYDTSYVSFQHAIDLQGTYALAWANACAALNKLGEPQHALDACDRSLQLTSDSNDPVDQKILALSNKAMALYSLERYQDAIATLDVALAIKPNDMHLQFNRVIILHAAYAFTHCFGSFWGNYCQ